MNPFSSFLRRVTHRLSNALPRSALKVGSLGIVDQTVISGTNFVFMIVAARELGPSAFGLFALLFMLLGVAQSIQESLITTPYTVISASKSRDDYRYYISSVAVLELIFAITSALVFILAALIALRISPGLTPALVALAVATATHLTQDFCRRVLYAESRIGAALVQDILTHGLRVIMLGALVLIGGVSESSLFFILGTAFFAGSLFGVWQIRGSLTIAFDRGILRQHWHFGNWLAASKIVSMVPHYVTATLLSLTLSVGAFGAYRAALQLVHAANVPLRSLDSLLRPKLARDAQRGPSAVSQTITPILLFGCTAFAFFAAILIVLGESLIKVIYGSEYVPYAAVIFLLALTPLMGLPQDVLSNALLAFHRTRAIFMRTLIGSLAGIVLGSSALLMFGLPAAGAISLISGIASVLWLVLAWKKQKRTESEASWQNVPASVAQRLHNG